MRITHACTMGLLLTVAGLAGCLGGADDEGSLRADFTVTPVDNTTFLFDATNSSGSIVEFHWNFGDGTLVPEPGQPSNARKVEMEYTFTDARVWASLVVVDRNGNKAHTVQPVTLGTGANTLPEIHFNPSARWVQPGSDVVLDVTGTHDHDGDGFTTEWFFGPYHDPMPPEAMYDTGNLRMDESHDQVFDTEGVYFIHCHPHPWMKGRVVVDSNATASNATASNDTVELEIFNYAFNGGQSLVVPPGTTVRAVNRDPVVHTATNYFAASGARALTSTDKVLRLSGLAPGDYQAHLFLDDHKGGLGAASSWGVRVSDDAPTIPFTTIQEGALTQFDDPVSHPFPARLEFPARITAELQFTNVPNVDPTVSFAVYAGAELVAPADCAGQTCTIITALEPGDHDFEVRVEAGAVTGYTIQVRNFVYYTDPGFGDVGGDDDGHVHDH